MSWYVKLFAPLIIGLLGLLVLIAAEWTNNDGLLPKGDHQVFIASLILAWGIIQGISFPQREHKKRYRFGIVLCVLIYPAFVMTAAYGGNPDEEWTIPIFMGAAVASILFVLRHREKPYSLAPRWAEIKHLTTLASLIIGAMFGLFLIDEVLLREFRISRSMPPDLGIAILVLWGIAATAAAVSYYVEAILHHLRRKPDAWEDRLQSLGKQ